MNRTASAALSVLVWLAAGPAAQDPAEAAGKQSQTDAVQELVASIRAAEAALTSLRLTMTTQGRWPGGLDVTTRGELRVLRGTQAGAIPGRDRVYSRLDYAFGDGLTGSMETAETADGIVLFEEDPAFGAVLLRIEPLLVADLAWAGEVLGEDGMPGMADRRAQSPLGSGMLADLARTFDLAVADDRERDGERGTWLRGARKAGLAEQEPDLPLADRVELFVRERDRALLAAHWFVGDELVQRVTVEALETGVALDAGAFAVDGRGQRLRDVQLYQPMWEQIEQVVARAEAKAPGGRVRPSRAWLQIALAFLRGWAWLR